MIGDDIVNEFDEPVAFVRQVLSDLAERVVALRGSGSLGPQHLAAMSSALEPVCADAITPEHPEIVGVGVVWVADETAGDASGMLWWRADGGVLAPKMHVYNPESDTYYDYGRSEWFRAARDSEGLAIVGPFIDAWGTDDHALTPSMAIVDDEGQFIGVAAADLDVAVITGQLARVLRPHGDLVLADAEDRAVASNYPMLSPGLRVDPFLTKSGYRVAERVPLHTHGWQLLRLARL
ncbi:cache domain-containing protein [Salinibacterium hongtaonis]|uniref:Uncharacterized protein n=1 Tax=Homoserinimonas hongtaonis TaxID=2079791 RepID=A0A2U1SY08_9MICO|nr:cache domain-containing protein [Salinibacterium hongtaonis]PWB96489.1 hypothetical protein DF220_00495 [Salinibacterium hongtaonis]